MGRIFGRKHERSPIAGALIELCRDRGFAAITVESLCERAGVERAAFESRYESLDQCLLETFTEELAVFHERVDPIRLGNEPWADRVRGTAYELFRFFAEDEEATRFLIFDVRAGGEQALLLFGSEFNTMVELIDEGRQCLADPDSVDRWTAEQISGGYFNQLYPILEEGKLPPEEEILPQLMYSAVLPYLGADAAERELQMPPPPDRRQERAAAKAFEADLGPLPAGRHGLSREQIAESQRERLLSAVVEVVVEKGFRAATISAITKRAAVSNRVFYENFDGKEECFLVAFDAVFDHFRLLLAAAAGAEGDPPRKVAVAVAAGIRFLAAEPTLARFCLFEPATASPAIIERFREAVLSGVPYLRHCREASEEARALPESTEDSILGGLVVLITKWAQHEGDPAAIQRDVIAFVLSPYLGLEQADRLAGEMD